MWKVQFAKRKSLKGRASREILMEIKRKIIEKGKGINTEMEGVMERRDKIGKEKRIVEVYVDKEIEKTLKNIVHWVEDKEVGVKTIIGGDFNARMGRKRSEIQEIEKEDREEEGDSRQKVK